MDVPVHLWASVGAGVPARPREDTEVLPYRHWADIEVGPYMNVKGLDDAKPEPGPSGPGNL